MDIKKFEEALNTYIRPASFPVGVKMVKPGEVIQTKAKSPKKDLGKEVLICQSVAFARRYGWSLLITPEELHCPLALTAFGFSKQEPMYSEGILCAGMYNASPEAGAKTEERVWKFSFGTYRAILVAPIQRVDFEPDVFVIYGNSAQVMRLVHAALFRRGGQLKSTFAGRLDCSEIVIQTLQTDECQVILPCYGDRVFGLAGDEEMAFSVPKSKIEDIIAGLEGTHNGGVRYPIPYFLRFQAEMPKTYEELLGEIRKEEGTLEKK